MASATSLDLITVKPGETVERGPQKMTIENKTQKVVKVFFRENDFHLSIDAIDIKDSFGKEVFLKKCSYCTLEFKKLIHDEQYLKVKMKIGLINLEPWFKYNERAKAYHLFPDYIG